MPGPPAHVEGVQRQVGAQGGGHLHLKTGLRHHRKGDIAEASWWWGFSYVSSWGNQASVALNALLSVTQLGHTAKSFTVSQGGVITDSVHGKAKIIDITPARIQAALAEGAIAIVPGFQGVSHDTKDVTTLGRGASDNTAVALAAALGAEVCEIYSDVDGVFTGDPRIVPTAASSTVSPPRRCSSWTRFRRRWCWTTCRNSRKSLRAGRSGLATVPNTSTRKCTSGM